MGGNFRYHTGEPIKDESSQGTYVYCTICYQLVCFRSPIDLNTPLNIHYMAFYCYSDYGDDGDYLLFHRGLHVILLQR